MEQARLSGHPETDDRIIRFGAFDLCLPTQELRKHGVRIRLQGKPFRILCALLEQPGHVVTREELRARLWSSDTFVDFESGLNTAVNRLRVALGDSADNPSYIETLARIGYRFIADISSEPLGNKVELGASQTAFAPAVSIGLRISDPVISLPEAALHARRRSPWLFAGIVSALSPLWRSHGLPEHIVQRRLFINLHLAGNMFRTLGSRTMATSSMTFRKVAATARSRSSMPAPRSVVIWLLKMPG